MRTVCSRFSVFARIPVYRLFGKEQMLFSVYVCNVTRRGYMTVTFSLFTFQLKNCFCFVASGCNKPGGLPVCAACLAHFLFFRVFFPIFCAFFAVARSAAHLPRGQLPLDIFVYLSKSTRKIGNYVTLLSPRRRFCNRRAKSRHGLVVRAGCVALCCFCREQLTFCCAVFCACRSC